MSIISRIKNKVISIVFWHSYIGEFANKLYDFNTFRKYSFKQNKIVSKQSLVASLTKDYHIVEKGLALPKTRNQFGENRIIKLIEKSKQYIHQYGSDTLIISIKSCLKEYYEFNKINNVILDTPFFNLIDKFVSGIDQNNFGGTKTVKRKDIVEVNQNLNYQLFVQNRSSVRDFDDSEIDIEKIKQAVNLSKFTPSVCNRQSWKAHFFHSKVNVIKVLKYQNGHSGFKEAIKGVFVITTNASMFTTLESNQIYIDGGLYSMSLLYALHYYNFGACPLNTCLPYIEEKKIKKDLNINFNERVIMMIAVGNLKSEYKVAISHKKDLNELLYIHDK